ncbi:Plasmid stabilization protein [Candidatus Nitrotoga sp. HW29]|uniref:type II toxin-antitoxin system RelE/ParE family toxin n=1 Tax=Candidatus Nitrotoga sp. HW29 TaxID=2886963 RepID=UPI001EF24F84|nr:type II toxin-antitoxin system RelE/ParE family toxin [Candidatus Nitrotoga sp. HW29]CAH1903596.1 Plasmid stabilization protein [Candidatus Nitrotoga sp. HW29]
MELKWTSKALSDLVRLYEFLSPLNKKTAIATVQVLTAAPAKLLSQPRIGEKLEEFEPREIRRILVGHYEMRYEIQQSTIYVLRLWHTREER